MPDGELGEKQGKSAAEKKSPLHPLQWSAAARCHQEKQSKRSEGPKIVNLRNKSRKADEVHDGFLPSPAGTRPGGVEKEPSCAIEGLSR